MESDYMDKDYLVTKSNYFIMNSSYDLSLEEQKLILTLASMVQPSDEEFKPYIFKISDFINLLGIENQSKYIEVPKITKELMKKVFEIQEGDTLIQTAWLSGAKYKKGSGEVELTFSPYLKPYMLKLNTMFTQYKLINILNMKSKYSPRIYEFLKCNEFKQQKCLEIKINDLRKLLKAEDIYPRYYDFKIKVIQQAQKELNKLTDLKFTFEEVKTGRKVTSIKFYITSNKVNTKNEIEAAKVSLPKENNDENIEKVKAIMSDHKISSLEAKKIYDIAEGNLKQIEKVYKYFKGKEADNFIGLMIKMVKPGVFQEPQKEIKQDSFNDYVQRKYDGTDGKMNLNELEKKLLAASMDGIA